MPEPPSRLSGKAAATRMTVYIDGSSGITIGAGNVLQINGQTFATASIENNSFTISFTSNGTIATSALVDNFLQHIGYQNSNATPGSIGLHVRRQSPPFRIERRSFDRNGEHPG